MLLFMCFQVSEFGYENCVLDNYKIVGRCSSPYVPALITFVLREFTPIPLGMEFSPGACFFFICTDVCFGFCLHRLEWTSWMIFSATSTGTGKGLKNRKGGLCQGKNLRLRLDILPSLRNPATSSPIGKNYRNETSTTRVRNNHSIQ